MTIGEFLHPLRKAGQRDLILAVMYFMERYEDASAVTTGDIKDAFARAKHAQGKKIQHASVLNQAVPYVEQGGATDGRVLWSLTDTGRKRVREMLGLPEADVEVEHEAGSLDDLARSVSDKVVRGYVEEAVKCLRVGALRASIVFLWTGAVAELREKLWAHGAAAIDAAVKTHDGKARDFKLKGDFAYVKDSILLQVAQDLQVIDKTEKGQLDDALKLRNGCGHPTKYDPGIKKASGFIEDVVGIVWK